MRIGPMAHIMMRPDRNVRFQGCSGLRQGATRTAISSRLSHFQTRSGTIMLQCTRHR